MEGIQSTDRGKVSALRNLIISLGQDTHTNETAWEPSGHLRVSAGNEADPEPEAW